MIYIVESAYQLNAAGGYRSLAFVGIAHRSGEAAL